MASLVYVYSRPAVFLSTARLQIEAPPGQRQSDTGDSSAKLLAEAQALTGGVVLDKVAQSINGAKPGPTGHGVSGDMLREVLSATPVPGTNVIELRAEGEQRELLPQILNAWIAVYSDTHANAHDQSSAQALDRMRGMVEQLRHNLSGKRREIEQFRSKFDIVSLQSEENAALARLKGLNTALNDARNREVSAEARLHAMRDSAAAGKGGVRPEDRKIIADLEQRANDLRDKIKDLELDYTQRYLALDPKYKALHANLTRLEQQIERERQTSAQQALQVAEDELVGARQAVLRLQQDLASRKQGAQDFTARFAEHAALASELRRIEESYDTAKERLTQLEIENKAAGPKVTILSRPSVPDRPLRPDYRSDALFGIAGAAILGLIAVWFVEFFKRSGMPQPAPLMQPIIQVAYAPGGRLDTAAPEFGGPDPLLLETSRRPREVSGPEVHALWEAAPADGKLVIAGLLGGLSLEELASLRWEDIDFDADRMGVSGPTARFCALREPLKQLLKERHAASSGPWPLARARGAPPSSADLEGLIACAACDAGLANPVQVDSGALRHTYLSYLVRQGAKLADIGAMIGAIAPAELREYSRISPPGPGLPLERIDCVFPALRRRAA